MDLAGLARYPFLPQAAGYIEREGPGLADLLGDRVYAGARQAGLARVVAALEEASLPVVDLSPATPTRELLEELLSYVYARILVSALADPFAVRRHALAEAVRVRALLLRDEPDAVLEAAGALGLAFERDGEAYRGHFTEFLRYAVHFKDLEWKLVRQPLARGRVRLDHARLTRLVQEALRRRVETELPKPLPPEVVKALAEDLAPLKTALAARKERYSVEGTFGKVDLTLMPPCMQHILGQLQRGENAAHNARFAIVTFLHKIGMSSEEIMRLFAQAPDFREDLTRYQVEHITGVSSGTTYSVPGCDNMQTFNLCHADDLCRTRTKAGQARVRYPGDYYRYMAEARVHVDAIAARVPLDEPRKLVFAAAMNYALLKKLEALAQRPHLAALDAATILRVVRERGIPIDLVGEGDAARLVVDERDPWAVPRLLESEWLRAAAAR